MSSSDSPLTAASATFSEVIDLALQLPADFDLHPLFSDDRLLRLHPNWFISNFEEDGTSFSADIKDYATENEFPLAGNFVFNSKPGELLRITLTETIEVTILFLNREDKLAVQVMSPQGDLEASDPLLLWIRAIREYIRLYTKKPLLPCCSGC